LANHKSAIKRITQNEKRRLRNRMVKSRVKTAIKTVHAAETGSADPIGQLRSAQSLIAKAAKKGVFHRKTASRKISRLAKRLNRASA